jgi:hypothetical protein
VVHSKEIEIMVENLSEALMDIRLTSERVRTRTELKARSVGLSPRSRELQRLHAGYLYVRLNGIGNAFSVNVEFMRSVNFSVQDPDGADSLAFLALAPVWRTGTLGTHGSDPTFVLEALDKFLDEFFNEYLKENAP